jgi:Alternative complex III, ActD subunit
MSGKNTAVFGLYPDETEVVDAIEQLKGAGFRAADLSILLPENLGSKDIGHEKHTKAPEGALAGGITGAVIGGALGWLTSAGMIMPPITGAGTMIVAILSGIGAIGTLGAIIGALIGVCSPEYEAKRYEGRMRNGAVLLSVHCDNAHWRIRAKNVLRNTGARSIASASESRADFGRSEKPMPRAQVNGLKRRTFLATERPASGSETPYPAEPALVEVHQADRRPSD